MIPAYLDSDNAIAAPKGDVDDAFAIAAILASGLSVAAIGSVAGNTAEPRALASNRRTAEACGFTGSILSGLEGPRFLATRSAPLRVVALGPLSSLSAALASNTACASHWTELVLVGGNLKTWGRRWLKRALRLKLRRSFPVWDLVAAMYAMDPGRRHHTFRVA